MSTRTELALSTIVAQDLHFGKTGQPKLQRLKIYIAPDESAEELFNDEMIDHRKVLETDGVIDAIFEELQIDRPDKVRLRVNKAGFHPFLICPETMTQFVYQATVSGELVEVEEPEDELIETDVDADADLAAVEAEMLDA